MVIKDYEKICEKEKKWAPRDRIRELLRKSPEKIFVTDFWTWWGAVHNEATFKDRSQDSEKNIFNQTIKFFLRV